MNCDLDKIERASDQQFATIVKEMRSGDITMKPGYDGVYGVLELPSSLVSQHSLFQAEAV